MKKLFLLIFVVLILFSCLTVQNSETKGFLLSKEGVYINEDADCYFNFYHGKIYIGSISDENTIFEIKEFSIIKNELIYESVSGIVTLKFTETQILLFLEGNFQANFLKIDVKFI